MRPPTAVSGRTSSSRVRWRGMGAVVCVEVVEEEEEEVEGFRRRGDVSEGEVSEGDGGTRVSAAVIFGGGDVVVLVVFGALVVGQDHGCLSMDEGGVKEVERSFWSHRTRHGPAGVDRDMFHQHWEHLSGFWSVLTLSLFRPRLLVRQAVAPQHIISRVLGVG